MAAIAVSVTVNGDHSGDDGVGLPLQGGWCQMRLRMKRWLMAVTMVLLTDASGVVVFWRLGNLVCVALSVSFSEVLVVSEIQLHQLRIVCDVVADRWWRWFVCGVIMLAMLLMLVLSVLVMSVSMVTEVAVVRLCRWFLWIWYRQC